MNAISFSLYWESRCSFTPRSKGFWIFSHPVWGLLWIPAIKINGWWFQWANQPSGRSRLLSITLIGITVELYYERGSCKYTGRIKGD